MTKEPWRFLGKSMLIETDGKRLLVLSDLHLGYDESLRRSGIHVPSNVFFHTMNDLKALLARVGIIDSIILLGDIKHAFGVILRDERDELKDVIDLFYKYTKEIILIRGNHDAVIGNLARDYHLSVVDFHVVGSFCFLHGDRDFKELYDSRISTWVMGHVHPALSLHEGNKVERYKCFLVGQFKHKRVIILPSFFPASEGSDIILQDLNVAWLFNVERFRVFVVGPDFSVLDFGTVAQCSH